MKKSTNFNNKFYNKKIKLNNNYKKKIIFQKNWSGPKRKSKIQNKN